MQTSKTRNRYKSSDKIPADHKTFIGSGTVEIGIDLNNASQFKIGLETNNGQVVRVVKGGIENLTIQIQTRDDVIVAVFHSPDSITAFKRAI